MKESKLIQMSKQLDALKRIVQQLIREIQANATVSGGTLEAFKIHVGEKEWELIIEELKDKEKRNNNTDKKLDLDVE